MKVILMAIVVAMFGTAAYAGNGSKVLESVKESERAEALAVIVHRTGIECGEVTQSFLQGYDKEDAAYWSITCSNGQSYGVQVQSDPNAISRVLKCSIMKSMGVECYKQFSDE